jgi:hypothetical protein
MTTITEKALPAREILLVGPYGVLGTGVLDAAAANAAWPITTAARRPPPTHRASTALRHINVDLLDRKGTMQVFSDLSTVTDLLFAAYLEKPTMAETVEPNARMLTNTLDALAARGVPLQRVVLTGGARSYGFHLGSFNAPAKETAPRLVAPIHYHQQEDILADWSEKNGASWTVLRPHLVMGPSLNSPMNLVTGLATYAAMSRELGLPLRYPGRREGWNTLQETTDAELFGRATLEDERQAELCAGRQKCLGVNHRGNGEVGWRPGAGHDACHGLIKVRPQPSNPAMSRVATAAPATKAVAAISASKASMGLPAWRRRMTISA